MVERKGADDARAQRMEHYMEVFLQVKSSQVKSSQVLGWTHLGWTHRLEALVFQVKRRGGLS